MAFRLGLVLLVLLLSFVVDSVHSDDGEPCSVWLFGIYIASRCSAISIVFLIQSTQLCYYFKLLLFFCNCLYQLESLFLMIQLLLWTVCHFSSFIFYFFLLKLSQFVALFFLKTQALIVSLFRFFFEGRLFNVKAWLFFLPKTRVWHFQGSNRFCNM